MYARSIIWVTFDQENNLAADNLIDRFILKF